MNQPPAIVRRFFYIYPFGRSPAFGVARLSAVSLFCSTQSAREDAASIRNAIINPI